ncbi:glycosyltransferase family 4 protein [Verrucomicrobiota bacterium]
MVLLHLLRWFKAHTGITFEVLLRRGGGLLADYEALAPVVCYRDLPQARPLATRIVNRLGLEFMSYRETAPRLETLLHSPAFDLVYANTITHGEALEELASTGAPVLCHVHELESVMRKYGDDNIKRVQRHVRRYIAVSEAVRTDLVERCGIAADRIDVVHEFISASDVAAGTVTPAPVRKELGIPADAFIVGGCGFTNWRKGKDLFVQLARAVAVRAGSRSVHFVWVGTWQSDAHRFEVEYDVAKAGIAGLVHFVPEISEPLSTFASFDVLAMTSREDPDPVVNLEAGLLERPVLCFAGSGGSEEFVGDDAGFVVPYLDVGAMADRVLRLAEDEPLRRRLGVRAAEKVRQRHDVAVAGPRIMDIVERVSRSMVGGGQRKEA